MHFFRRPIHIPSAESPSPSPSRPQSHELDKAHANAPPARAALLHQLLSVLLTDPTLLTLLTSHIPHLPHAQAHLPHLLDTAPCDRPFPYGVSRASDSLSMAMLRATPQSPHLRRPASRSTLTMRQYLHFTQPEITSHAELPSIFASFPPPNSPKPRLHSSSSSPIHQTQQVSLASEEQPLPPQLPTTSTLPTHIPQPGIRRMRPAFSHPPRHAHTPTSFNPFATAFLQPPPNTLDVFNNLTLDLLQNTLPTIRTSVLLPFSTVPPHHHPHFISLIHGTRPPSAPFIFEPYAARIWQEDMTWRKEVRGTKPIAEPSSVLDVLQPPRTHAHPNWACFLACILARMLAVSAGLLQRGHECLRAIVSLQTIREMLRLRFVVRTALRSASEFPDTMVDLPGFGAFDVTQDGWLVVDGCDRPDLALLDPTMWRSQRDVARALVAWTNVETDVVEDAASLFAGLRLTIRAVASWSRIALQFSAAHDIDKAIAFVGVIRFLFVRKWMGSPEIQRDGVVSDVKSADYLMCANEFVDMGVAVPEIEACLPDLLDVSRVYAGGHDIDCGALTRAEVVEAGRIGGMTSLRMGKSRSSWVKKASRVGGNLVDDDRLDGRSMSSWSLIGLRRRRVVMSVWTDDLNGSEWYVPRSTCTSIDFKMEGTKYRLGINKGQVICERIGSRMWMRRRRKETGSGLALRGVGRGSRHGMVDVREAVGSIALCNAFDRVYGDRVCFHVLGWLQRGLVRLNDMCGAAAFVPRRCLGGDLVVNRRLPFEVCRRMVFGRRGHELYWMPGHGLPCFRVSDCANGCYQLTEMSEKPVGVELCRAEISKDFG